MQYVQKSAMINNELIEYTSVTPFHVQRGRKRDRYKTLKIIIGDLDEAIKFYHSIELKNGDKKRLMCFDLADLKRKPTLLRLAHPTGSILT